MISFIFQSFKLVYIRFHRFCSNSRQLAFPFFDATCLPFPFISSSSMVNSNENLRIDSFQLRPNMPDTHYVLLARGLPFFSSASLYPFPVPELHSSFVTQLTSFRRDYKREMITSIISLLCAT